MEEALDLKGDLARWQVLCKAPFLNTSDSRVAHRLEEGQWAWYYRTALRTVIQACGRVIRSPDDYGATYLADSSLLQLFDRAEADTPPWFAEQVERMSRPDLPDFDPRSASESNAGASGSRGGNRTGDRGQGRNSASDAGSADQSETTAQDGRSSDDSSSEKATSARPSKDKKSPMADVWDVE
jgi:hypothetical protein